MKQKKILMSLSFILGLVFFCLVIFFIVGQIGKKNLSDSVLSGLTNIVGESSYETIFFEGEEYVYRDNTINILCMGIDKLQPMGVRNDADSSMGQSDAIFVLSIDLEENKIRMIAVPRDTIVDLQIYKSDETYIGKQKGPITLQYAYGDGRELSATLMVQQVSTLMGNIPIHAYLAVNVRTLWALNNAVGGVDVVMDADYTKFNPAFVEGETVHLEGNLMENFIRERDKSDPDGAYTRMHRMKLYVMAFFEKAKTVVKKDMTLPVRMMSVLENDIVMNLSSDEVIYLITEGMNCSFLAEDMYTLPGENQMVKGYMEFRLNEREVQKLLLELFYDKK